MPHFATNVKPEVAVVARAQHTGPKKHCGVLPHVVASCDETAHPNSEDQGDGMMNWNDMGSGMGFGMEFGWLFGLLILLLVVLAIAALIKYLRK
ncbi:hypothetical protein GCM10008966_15070 [Rhodovulum strictum]